MGNQLACCCAKKMAENKPCVEIDNNSLNMNISCCVKRVDSHDSNQNIRKIENKTFRESFKRFFTKRNHSNLSDGKSSNISDNITQTKSHVIFEV